MNYHTRFLLVLLFFLPIINHAQDAKPVLLTVPENWSFEFIPFPPDFAPELNFQGFEELRFSPGMFDPKAKDYFTYLFAIELEEKHEFGLAATKSFLMDYFQGLCHSVAVSKELSVDTSQIRIEILKPDIPLGKHEGYFATVKYIDTFNDGVEVDLYMEVVVLYPKSKDKTYLQALVSSKPKYSEVWKELYQYRKTLMSTNPVFVNLRTKK